MIKKKYKKENSELIRSLEHMGRDVAVLEIKLIGTSKVKDNLIYECIFMERSQINRIPIIAQDMTQALAKLDQYTQFGIPESVLQYMLGNERFS